MSCWQTDRLPPFLWPGNWPYNPLGDPTPSEISSFSIGCLQAHVIRKGKWVKWWSCMQYRVSCTNKQPGKLIRESVCNRTVAEAIMWTANDMAGQTERMDLWSFNCLAEWRKSAKRLGKIELICMRHLATGSYDKLIHHGCGQVNTQRPSPF